MMGKGDTLGTPHGPGMGYPSPGHGMGYPPPGHGMGYPPGMGWGTPRTWDGVPPGHGMGYPSDLGWDTPPGPGMGSPAPPQI